MTSRVMTAINTAEVLPGKRVLGDCTAGGAWAGLKRPCFRRTSSIKWWRRGPSIVGHKYDDGTVTLDDGRHRVCVAHHLGMAARAFIQTERTGGHAAANRCMFPSGLGSLLL